MVMDLRKTMVSLSIVVYPVIPKGHIIYRLPTATHTEDIDRTLVAFEETKKKLDGVYQVAEIPAMADV